MRSLRDSIVRADISRYAISRKTGIAESALSRFVNGKSGLSLESIDLIADCLGLRLVADEKPKPRKGR